MEKITAKDFIDNFASNQVEIELFRNDYPEGLSVEDLCENDIVDIIHDYDDFIYVDGERTLILDGLNFDTRYEI